MLKHCGKESIAKSERLSQTGRGPFFILTKLQSASILREMEVMRDGCTLLDAPCGMNCFTLLFEAKGLEMEYHTTIPHRMFIAVILQIKKKNIS